MELAMHVWSVLNFGKNHTSFNEGKELRCIGCVDLPSNILPWSQSLSGFLNAVDENRDQSQSFETMPFIFLVVDML